MNFQKIAALDIQLSNKAAKSLELSKICNRALKLLQLLIKATVSLYTSGKLYVLFYDLEGTLMRILDLSTEF